MKNFLSQLSCGALPLILLWGSVAFLVSFTLSQGDGSILSTQISEFSTEHYLYLVALMIFGTTYLVFILLFSAYVWLKVATIFISPQEARRIFHLTYRTPTSGFAHSLNVRYVNWVLKNA